mmetsp:Transcript_33144/g.60077  ORF Transcript_33144/g.60077 Transcript_33144/m.60077 type:complete len:101 (+) Transcript_33144:77-379(+)
MVPEALVVHYFHQEGCNTSDARCARSVARHAEAYVKSICEEAMRSTGSEKPKDAEVGGSQAQSSAVAARMTRKRRSIGEPETGRAEVLRVAPVLRVLAMS